MADAAKHPAWDQIEPAACEGHRVPGDIRPGEHEIELSKAISLKRIADAICGDERSTGIHKAIIDIADAWGKSR